MKRKGNINIITDSDVIVTGNSNAGNNLDTVVENMSKDILDLKSQLKWTHKYGAVGGGGGSSSSTKWNLVATLDGQTIGEGNVISLSKGASTYSLKIAISGGSASYSVTYTYGGISRSIQLNAENRWKLDTTVQLSANGTVSVEVTDNIQIKNVFATYIVSSFKLGELQLVRSAEYGLKQYASNDIYIELAAVEGLYVKLDYEISVNAECTYEWNFLDEEPVTGEITNKNGYIIFQIPEKYLAEEYANAYNVDLTVKITPDNQSTQIIKKSIVFNLIPGRIYLKVEPQTGLVYDTEQSGDDYYKYSINREIGFNCRVYQGTNQSRACTIVYWKDDESTREEFNGIEGETYTLKISYSTPGWHKITFSYNIGTASGITVKYLYCQQVSSSYNWFKSSIVPNTQIYYKGYENNKTYNLKETINTSTIQIYRANTTNTIYHFEAFPQDINNALINVGIQYNEINNIVDPICIIRSNESTSTNTFITIYQDKIEFSGVFGGAEQTCNFFLHKENNYAPGNPDNFHLITISIAPVYYDEASNLTYYEYNVFVDGVFEGAINTWPTAVKILGSIEFLPGNYTINHFSVDYFLDSVGVSALHDTDINYYYYTYKVKSTNNADSVSEEDTRILNFLYDSSTDKVNYYMKHDLVHVENTLYDNIASLTNIPTLVVRVSEVQTTISGEPTIYEWMNTSYTQDSTSILADAEIPINQLRWGRNKNQTSVINIPSSFNNYYFYLKLQGSSTMNNKSKNFVLGLKSSDAGETTTLVYSPNYKRSDNTTFLHETQFNLKADVVDSAHSNNVAMGKFINDHNKFEYSMGSQSGNADILSHVRQCLDGFPVLMYLEVVLDSKIDVYYLGVYSFNLGRESYFNLGYADLSQLKANYIEDCGDTSFSFTTVGQGNDRGLNPLEGFVAAEVQDNSKYWDFSQYDDTILFQQNGESSNFMFGDIVTYAGNPGAKTSIKNFVKSVSLGGGYLFGQIGKSFEPINDPENPTNDSVLYHTINIVPDYKTQYHRNGTLYTKKNEQIADATYSDLFNCIGGLEEGALIKGKLNYNSVVYYMTTCMTYGLVDSVQKNLNIKTWDDNEFGLFFYDMDTCLGRDNDGNTTSYFSFTDYWKSDIKEYDSSGKLIDRTKPEDANKIAATTINNGVTVYRDYFPSSSSIVGYDIPSSYLFAIAKYTKALDNYKDEVSFLSPQTIYGNWRASGGPLETADKFIQKYYASNLAEVPSCMLNLNYRNKYLYYREGEPDRKSFATVSKYLFGRGVEVTTEWLRGRLHILDAYFNTQGSDIIIYKGDTTYLEPIRTTVGLENNKDIVILKDIFQSGSDPWRRKSSNLEFIIKAPAYTPLVIRGASSLSRYLLEKENLPYTIKYSFNGVQTSVFGGSQLWRDLDYIDSFVESSSADNGAPLYINNKYLEHINGASGSYSGGFSFVLPAVRTIVLNSPGYSGSLAIDDTFYNLSTIDISKSGISLDINGSRVTSIDARNINSSSLSLVNCNNLQSVQLTNASVASCDIRPAWTKDIDVSNNKIKSLSISGKRVNNTYGKLNIVNNSSITDVDFAKFNTVNINNCTALKSVTHSDNPSELTSLTIQNCTALTSLVVYVDKLNTLNLSGCTNLVSLTLKGTDFTKLRKLDLYQTKVSYITYDDGVNTNCLDISRFTNLANSTNSNTAYFRIGSNSAVSEIQFKNTVDKVYLLYNFRDCTNLKRIYGNVAIYATSCFKDLKKFSIHGSNLSTVKWKNQSVLNGTKVKHPADISSELYSSGKGVTNITFGITDGSYGFYNTNCTLFDYYYLLYNIGAATSISCLFAYTNNTTYGKFDLSTNNNPDIRLFDKCGNVTSISFIFGYNSGKTIYIPSPTVSAGSVTVDNGLFSKLVNCRNFTGVFYSYSYVIDRFLFRRTSGNYSITHLDYFTPSRILNVPPATISMSSLSQIYNDVKGNTGNLNGFFNNTPNLQSVSGIFNNVHYIDYSKGFKIPSKVTYLKGAFVSTYAYSDNFELSDFFVNAATVQSLLQSFKMTSAPNNDYHVIMNLHNNTFSKFTNIVEIGYGGSGDFSSSNYFESCFKGFTKKFENEFPFSIFKNNTKVTKLAAIFMDVSSDSPISNLELPGDLFINNTKLTDISAMFYNFKVPYTLSSTGSNFKTCTKIAKLDYAFAEDAVNSKLPSLSGSIPYKFFWHGENTATKTLYGTNTREEITDSEGQVTGYEYTNVQPYVVKTKTVNNTISSMQYCFQHSNISYYTNNDIDEDVENNPTYSPYLYYSESENGPFKTNTNVDTRQYTFMWVFDGAHFPSGYNDSTKDNYEMLDSTVNNTNCTYENVVISTGGGTGEVSNPANTYIAPPDLLRYCTNNCNITGLFACSGLSGWSYRYNNGGGYNMYGYGLTGRICPYMLKPVPDITNVSNMFKFCKRLSYYRYDFSNMGNAYMIPEDFFKYAPRITNLTGMFQDTLQPQISELKTVFAPLTGTLTLTNLFYGSYWDGGKYSGIYTQLSEVFVRHEVASTQNAFCITTEPSSSPVDRTRNQYIKFNKMFNSKYSSSSYSRNTNYSNTFRGYTKLGSGTENERFGTKTLVDNIITNNYTL